MEIHPERYLRNSKPKSVKVENFHFFKTIITSLPTGLKFGRHFSMVPNKHLFLPVKNEPRAKRFMIIFDVLNFGYYCWQHSMFFYISNLCNFLFVYVEIGVTMNVVYSQVL